MTPPACSSAPATAISPWLVGGPEDWAQRTGRALASGLTSAAIGTPRLGLRANAAQFTLLVAVNALVGGMLGQQRPSCRCSPSASSA